jgi:hypothetical protein
MLELTNNRDQILRYRNVYGHVTFVANDPEGTVLQMEDADAGVALWPKTMTLEGHGCPLRSARVRTATAWSLWSVAR